MTHAGFLVVREWTSHGGRREREGGGERGGKNERRGIKAVHMNNNY